MRCFHFYIDDWLSSKHIRRMDAGEERGYLRLLLYAASEPDCGLPNDRSELADISLLNSQWFKPTQDPNKCFRDQTSGEKILACFFTVRDGQTLRAVDNTPITLDPRHAVDISRLAPDRLYNQRLLKEFQYQQDHKKQCSDAGKRSAELRGGKFWAPNRQPTGVGPSLGSPLDTSLDGSLEREAERKGNNDVNVCVSASVLTSSSLEQETSQPKNGKYPEPSDLGVEGWDELVELGASVQMVMDPDPSSDLCQRYWRHLSFEDRLKRLTALREKKACGQFEDPRYVPSLENFVRTKYRESHRPSAKPIDRGAALIARYASEEKPKPTTGSTTHGHSPPKSSFGGMSLVVETKTG